MSNTTRTRAQLWALFPDNTTREIVPQDDRDFIASAFPFLALIDPGVNNDNIDSAGIGAFFDSGNLWLNLTSGILWSCISGQPTAAIWSSGPTPTPPVPPPGSLLLDGSTQYLFYNGAGFTTAPGIAWSFGIWLKAINNSPTQLIFFCQDPGSGQIVEIYLDSGNANFHSDSAFGGAADISFPFANDGNWHYLLCGYSATDNVAFISVDNGTRVTAVPPSAQVGITGTVVAVGCTTYGGTPHAFFKGELDEFMIAGEISDEWQTDLFNSTDGLYYRQTPCQLFHTVINWFPFDELLGDRVDASNGLILSPAGNPGSGDAICGWRFGVPEVIYRPVAFVDQVSFGSFSDWTNTLFTPSPPPAGATNLYIDSTGTLVTMNSMGVVTPVAPPITTPGLSWIKYTFNWTQTQTVFVGEHFYVIAAIPLNRIILRILSQCTQAWAGGALNGATGPVNAGDTSLQTHWNSCASSVQTNAESQWNCPSGDTNFGSNGTYFLAVVAQTGVTPTAGATTLWVEVYDFAP
jgi:hypothetical protein